MKTTSHICKIVLFISICFLHISSYGQITNRNNQGFTKISTTIGIVPYLIPQNKSVISPSQSSISINSDSSKFYSTIGYFGGIQFSRNIYKSLEISVGLESSIRKFKTVFYGDSLIPFDFISDIFNKLESTYYTLELPVSISHNFQNLSVGGGILLPVYQVINLKYFYEQQIVHSSNIQHFFQRRYLPNIIFLAHISYDLEQVINLPLKLTTAYEFNKSRGCSIKVSLNYKIGKI